MPVIKREAFVCAPFSIPWFMSEYGSSVAKQGSFLNVLLQAKQSVGVDVSDNVPRLVHYWGERR